MIANNRVITKSTVLPYVYPALSSIQDANQQLAVTRYFCFKQLIIPEEQYVKLATTIKPAYVPAHKRQQPSTNEASDHDSTMGDAANNSTNIARADEESAPVA